MKTCYIFLAEGFEEVEALTVVDLLRRDRLNVEMVSIADTDTVTGSHGITVKTDTKIKDVDIKQAGLLVLPGGMPGTKNLAACGKLTEMLRQFHTTNKRIAAICAAPSVLGQLGLLKGKKAVCYPGYEEQLTGAEILYEEVVTDGNITTSRGLGTAIPFALELIRQIDCETEAGAMKTKIVYKQ